MDPKKILKWISPEVYDSDGWILLYVIFISMEILEWIPCIDNLLCVKHDIRKFIHINLFNSPNNPFTDEETKSWRC